MLSIKIKKLNPWYVQPEDNLTDLYFDFLMQFSLESFIEDSFTQNGPKDSKLLEDKDKVPDKNVELESREDILRREYSSLMISIMR